MPELDQYTLVPATTAATVVIKGAPGRLRMVSVTTTGTGSASWVNIYNNASAGSGDVLLAVPSNAAAGTLYNVNMPADLGITALQVTNGPALTCSYW
jgi:hypothetical protein